MADANGYPKAMQMNDTSKMMLYHNESRVINQMIDHTTDKLSEKATPFNKTELIGG